MSKVLRPILLIFSGLIIGLVVYHQFGTQADERQTSQDTSFVKTASAQRLSALDSMNNDDVSRTRRNALTRAINNVSPAVVSVNVTKVQEYVQRNPYQLDPFFRDFFPEFFENRRFRQLVKAVGSGFIVSEDGYILTNEHVVENATEVIVAMGDGMEHMAEMIGIDPVTDVALLKIDKKGLPYIPFGDSDNIIIGEWAIALGNPFGLFIKSKPTVTVGVISAVDRNFPRQQGRVYEDMIQTDAAINNGNSGGPLCNADGEVIGMNTFIVAAEREGGSVGIGFAIPINRINRIIDDLKNQRGVDRNIWIGLYISNLSRFLARQLGYPSTEGVYVAQIDRGSPAELAGIRLGDIIIKINDREIKNDREAENVILSTDLKVGDRLKIRIWREGKEIDLSLALGKRTR